MNIIKKFLVYALVTFFAITKIEAGNESVNLLQNPGFEIKGKAWTSAHWGGEGTKSVRKWTTDAHTGKLAIEIIGTTRPKKEKPGGLFYSSAIKGSSGMYTISGYYKTEANGSARVAICSYSTDEPVPVSCKKKYKQFYIGKSDKWTFFEKTLLLDDTCKQIRVLLRNGGIGSTFFDDVRLIKSSSPINAQLFPGRWAYGNEVYLIKDNVAPVTFVLSGDTTKLKYPVSFDIIVPDGIKLYGVMPMMKKSITREGRKASSYTIELSKDTIEKKFHLKKTLSYRANIVLWAEAKNITEKGKLLWRCRNSGEDNTWEKADIIVKPAIAKEPRPKNFKIAFTWSLYNKVPRELWDRVYSLYRAAGVNCYLVTYSLGSPDSWKDYCIKKFRENGGKLIWNLQTGKTSKLEKTLKREGGWQRILNQGVKGFAKLENGLKHEDEMIIDGHQWDFEPWMQPASVDLFFKDELAINRFAEKIGVPRSELTLKKLQTTYKKEYSEFYDTILADVIRLWQTYVQQKNPDAFLLMIHGTGLPNNQLKDEFYDDAGVMHSPMVYKRGVTEFYEQVKGLKNRISGDVWPVDSTGLIKSKEYSVARPPWVIRMDILSVASLGAVGWQHWPDMNRAMDGLYVWEMARAASAIAPVEDFFQKGKCIDDQTHVEGLAETVIALKIKGKTIKVRYPDWRQNLIHHSRQLGKQRLISIFNFSIKDTAYVKVSIKGLPSGKYYLTDTITKTAFTPSETGEFWNKDALMRGVTIKVNPKDTVFLKVSPDKQNGLADKIALNKVKEDFLRIKKKRRKENKGDGALIRKDGLTITWGDVDDDGVVEAVLESASQKVWISPAGGRVWGWSIANRKSDLIRRGKRLGVCMDDFLIPKRARAFKDSLSMYRVVKRVIKDGKASVTLERSIKDDNAPQLFVSKTYSIEKEKTSLTIDLQLANEDIRPVSFSYWSRNSIQISQSPAQLVYPSLNKVFVEPGGKSCWITRADLGKKQLDETMTTALPPIVKNWFATYNKNEKEAVVVHVVYDSLLQIYKWQGSSSDTLEWMYQPITLEPGISWKTSIQLEYRKSVSWK